MADGAGLLRRTVRRDCCCCVACPAGIISTAAYDVNVPFMQLERNARNLRKPCAAFSGGFLLVRALHRGRDGAAERRGYPPACGNAAGCCPAAPQQARYIPLCHDFRSGHSGRGP